MRDRIKKIMDSEDLTPSAFADKLDIGRAVMSHLLNGRNKPSLDVVTRILDEMNFINSDWLIKGEGEMYKKGTTRNPEKTSDEKMDGYRSSKDDLFSQSNLSPIANTSISQAQMAPQPQLPTQPTVQTNIAPQQAYHQPENSIQPTPPTNNKQIDDQGIVYRKSNDAKKVTKIIIYYNDNTFETFEADNKPL